MLSGEEVIMLKLLQPLVLSDFDRLVFDTFVPSNHYLRKSKAFVDFERFHYRLSDRRAVDP